MSVTDQECELLEAADHDSEAPVLKARRQPTRLLAGAALGALVVCCMVATYSRSGPVGRPAPLTWADVFGTVQLKKKETADADETPVDCDTCKEKANDKQACGAIWDEATGKIPRWLAEVKVRASFSWKSRQCFSLPNCFEDFDMMAFCKEVIKGLQKESGHKCIFYCDEAEEEKPKEEKPKEEKPKEEQKPEEGKPEKQKPEEGQPEGLDPEEEELEEEANEEKGKDDGEAKEETAEEVEEEAKEVVSKEVKLANALKCKDIENCKPCLRQEQCAGFGDPSKRVYCCPRLKKCIDASDPEKWGCPGSIVCGKERKDLKAGERPTGCSESPRRQPDYPFDCKDKCKPDWDPLNWVKC